MKSAGSLLSVFALLTALPASAERKATCNTEVAAKKRGPPPKPPIVEDAKVRYRAIVIGFGSGLAEPGAYVVATNRRTESELWRVLIYPTGIDPQMEQDKQDVFIARMTIIEGGRAIRVVDERGRRYRLGLFSHEVAAIGC